LLGVALALACGSSEPDSNDAGAAPASSAASGQGGADGLGVGGSGPGGSGGAAEGIGGPDVAFGDNGALLTTLEVWPWSMVQDEEQRLLVFGIDTQDDGIIEVVRVAPDGSLDETFGPSGKKALQIGAPGPSSSIGLAIGCALARPEGIYICGHAKDATDASSVRPFVARLRHEDGELDPAFSGGVAWLDVPGAEALAIASNSADDLLVHLGTTDSVDPTTTSTSVARLGSSGAVDTSFGSDGFVHFPTTRRMGGVALGCIAQTVDGLVRAIAAVAGDEKSGLVLLTATSGGVAMTAPLSPPKGDPTGCAFDDQGSVTVWSTGTDNQGVLERFLATTAVDASYGEQGTATTQLESLQGALAEANGQVFAAGRSANGFPTIRYVSQAGEVHPQAWQVADISAYYYAVLRQTDGKIVVAGDRDHEGQGNRWLVLARYVPPQGIPLPK
jgi:uncharacterized delta-60 repeat protein